MKTNEYFVESGGRPVKIERYADEDCEFYVIKTRRFLRWAEVVDFEGYPRCFCSFESAIVVCVKILGCPKRVSVLQKTKDNGLSNRLDALTLSDPIKKFGQSGMTYKAVEIQSDYQPRRWLVRRLGCRGVFNVRTIYKRSDEE